MEEREWREYKQKVAETVKWCEERKGSPLVWAAVVGKLAPVVPSPELGQALVSLLCFEHNRPSLWKFLEQSLGSGLLFPIHVLSILSARVIPNRHSQPKAYILYLELLSLHSLSFTTLLEDVSKEKIMKGVDGALLLSRIYDVPTLEFGHTFVLFFFRIVDCLIDILLDDWDLLKTSSEKSSLEFGSTDDTDMDIDSRESQISEKDDNRGVRRITTSFKVMEVLGKLTESRKAMLLLRLVHVNMAKKFDGLLHRLQLLKAHWLASADLNPGTQLFVQFYANIQRIMGFKHQLDKHHLIGKLIESTSNKPFYLCNFESDLSASWIPLDIYFENAMDGKQLPIKSAIYVLSEVTKTLQVLNQATWQETFLALWLSALRLVQRERNSLEGPIPHLDTRLCVLLSIVPLAIAKILEDEMQSYSSLSANSVPGYETGYGHDMNGKARFPRKHGLILALQVLGQFSCLVCPPISVVDAADNAARKAARFIRSSRNEDYGVDSDSYHLDSVKAGGNMRHLIVEVCIARNIIDTSAYFWPDYVTVPSFSSSETTPIQQSPWLAFMEGAPLSESLADSLFSTPAPSLVEIEKLYDIALNGSEEQKPVAAKILCGASLRRGWNIQEHVVRYVVKLLCPPVPPNYSGARSHLIDYMPMLISILYRASSIDIVHILSLHGVVPEVAASLVPVCEVFGSLEPTLHKSTTGDEPSIYMVFSLAFLFLLRLWKFYRPPVEQCITEYTKVAGVDLNLEHLLFLHNSRNIYFPNETKSNSDYSENTSEAVYIDSYPKLRSWYLQNVSCVTSKLCSLSTDSPIYQVATTILNMIYLKMTNGESTSSISSSGSSPTTSTGEGPFQRPVNVPPWQMLEAIPFVLEALLTACACGRISSRHLTTGLRDLVDFLPAALVSIISYFSAEVTRGLWKPVPMNGTDWPSPAPIIKLVESEIKGILANVGVDMPSSLTIYSSGLAEVTLPMPMAALVSLTITFKLDKNLEYIHAVAGPALEHCASGCPWPGMPIVSCLWAQKVRRWHDFIVVSSSRSVFRHNKEAVHQLLRNCFVRYLGLLGGEASTLTKQRSVNGLLGYVISAATAPPSVAPGFLFLRSCRAIQNVLVYVNDVIARLVLEYARGSSVGPTGPSPSARSRRLKSGKASLCLDAARLREVATLGSSLLCVAGGFRLIQELYTETIPTWLISSLETKSGEVSDVVCIMEGYSMAYLSIHSGSVMWGLQANPPEWMLKKRLRILGAHMDFLSHVLEGKALGPHPGTWKAYVTSFLGLMVKFAPTWIPHVKHKTLRTLATGLKDWRERELALSLLEKGGVEAMGSAAEFVNFFS